MDLQLREHSRVLTSPVGGVFAPVSQLADFQKSFETKIQAMKSLNEDVSQTLERVFGLRSFRGMQENVVRHVAAGGDAFVLMPTGGGKSICYQVPALVRPGVAIVISPLVSLMKDQVDALRAKGIAAAALTSGTSFQEAQSIANGVRRGSLDFLYVSPERIAMDSFRGLAIGSKISLFAIDEAHCVSTWGHDFRESYLKITEFIDLRPDVPRIALTATADEKTRQDVASRLGLLDASFFISSFDRPNIEIDIRSRFGANAQLMDLITEPRDGPAIVFCGSKKKVDEVTEFLISSGINAIPYHAGLDKTVRSDNQDRFMREANAVVVATVAFGMGIDKPDVRLVVHMDMPPTVEGYYQEIGRAGRDGLACRAVMFASDGDAAKAARLLLRELDETTDQSVKRRIMGRVLKLHLMHGYVESANCRRQTLLRCFGEDFASKCGNCDRCKAPIETRDATEDVRLFLDAVTVTSQRFGFGYLTEILGGIHTERVGANDHSGLGVFGAGKHLSRRRWASIYRQLLADGFIANGDAGNVVLRDAAWPVKMGNARIHVASDQGSHMSRVKERRGDGLPSERKTLLDAFVEKRRQIALKRDVPAYEIMSDRDIEKLVAAMPSTHEELVNVAGIGPGAVAIGAELAEIVSDHLASVSRDAAGHVIDLFG